MHWSVTRRAMPYPLPFKVFPPFRIRLFAVGIVVSALCERLCGLSPRRPHWTEIVQDCRRHWKFQSDFCIEEEKGCQSMLRALKLWSLASPLAFKKTLTRSPGAFHAPAVASNFKSTKGPSIKCFKVTFALSNPRRTCNFKQLLTCQFWSEEKNGSQKMLRDLKFWRLASLIHDISSKRVRVLHSKRL